MSKENFPMPGVKMVPGPMTDLQMKYRGDMPVGQPPSYHFGGLFARNEVNDPTVGQGGLLNFSNSSSPVNYMNLFQRTDPFWGQARQSSAMQMLPGAPFLPQTERMFRNMGFGPARRQAEMSNYAQRFNPWDSYRKNIPMFNPTLAAPQPAMPGQQQVTAPIPPHLSNLPPSYAQWLANNPEMLALEEQNAMTGG